MSNTGKYKGIGELFASGDRSMLADPFDYLLIDACPEEGTSLGGLYQLGASAVELADKVAPTPDVREIVKKQIGPRLTVLHMLDLIRPVTMVGGRGSRSWQKTKKGEEVVKEWQQQKQ